MKVHEEWATHKLNLGLWTHICRSNVPNTISPLTSTVQRNKIASVTLFLAKEIAVTDLSQKPKGSMPSEVIEVLNTIIEAVGEINFPGF